MLKIAFTRSYRVSRYITVLMYRKKFYLPNRILVGVNIYYGDEICIFYKFIDGFYVSQCFKLMWPMHGRNKIILLFCQSCLYWNL